MIRVHYFGTQHSEHHSCNVLGEGRGGEERGGEGRGGEPQKIPTFPTLLSGVVVTIWIIDCYILLWSYYYTVLEFNLSSFPVVCYTVYDTTYFFSDVNADDDEVKFVASHIPFPSSDIGNAVQGW